MSLQKPAYIYALCHPVTNEVKYIGKTVNLQKRFGDHCYTKFKTKMSCWSRSLKPLKPEMIILEQIEKDWQEAEIFWIAYFKSLGANLVNHSLGGEGNEGLIHSEESKLKISNSLKGNQHLKGFVFSEESKEKISNSLKGNSRALGNKLSKETCEKMSVSHIGNKNSLGFKHTEEFKKRCSEKGKNISEETRLKMSNSQKGRKHSEETKLKIALGNKKLKPRKLDKELSNV